MQALIIAASAHQRLREVLSYEGALAASPRVRLELSENQATLHSSARNWELRAPSFVIIQ